MVGAAAAAVVVGRRRHDHLPVGWRHFIRLFSDSPSTKFCSENRKFTNQPILHSSLPNSDNFSDQWMSIITDGINFRVFYQKQGRHYTHYPLALLSVQRISVLGGLIELFCQMLSSCLLFFECCQSRKRCQIILLFRASHRILRGPSEPKDVAVQIIHTTHRESEQKQMSVVCN